MAEKSSAGESRGANRRRPFNEDEQRIVDGVLDLFSRAFARNEYVSASTDEPSTSEAGPGPSETGPGPSEAGLWHCSLSGMHTEN